MAKTLIAITGPTASGKTSLAIELALHFNTAILSFDSRQCYKELNIGVAKPTDAQLKQVPHHFINSHSIHEQVDAVIFEQYALQVLEKLFADRDLVIAVGGTGLYLKVLCEGIDNMPAIDPELRTQLRNDYAANGLQWLQQKVAQEDPSWYAIGEIYNPQRMLRALEVKMQTGGSILAFQQGHKKQRPFEVKKLAIEVERDALYDRINNRVDEMIDMGLVDEVKQLLPFERLQALQTVGYTEIFDYLHDHCSLEEAIEEIKTNSRHYAKRQLTWFRKDPEIKWLPQGTVEAALSALQLQ